MSTFYQIDSTRVSHQEIWWWHKSPFVLLSWMLKWTRTRIPCSSDDPNTDSTLPFVTDALPPEIAAGFEPLTGELNRLGFSDPVYHVIADPGTRATIYWATFRHESGSHFARIHQRIWHQAQKHNRGLFPMFFTAFTDGTFLVSSAGKPDMAAPATVQMNRRFGASPARLWQTHQERLEKISNQKLISPVRSREDVIELTERHHVLVRDFHLARGVFRPRTPAEQAQADTFATTVEQARSNGLEHAEVLAELQKLQEEKPGWAATIPILVISLLLFVVIGAARWDWHFTLILIPVLLFHECGHWAAMRIFHYRNLRMFFIPLFGAAVTGRNWNVPGWQKAVVSLAGPLPGIVLGIFLGVAGVAWKVPALNEAAFLLLFINGLNLLPVLPMDGGHVLHTILFCRNRWLDITFRVLAIGGLLLLSVARLGQVFLFVGILMALSLPAAFKLAHITDQLRKQPLPEPQPGEDRIPVPAAQAIITEVKATFPRNLSNKQIAQHTLNVFETLNAKPPGVLGTLSLLAVHGGALFLVLVFGLVLALSRTGGLGDFAKAALRQPEHVFQSGDLRQWRGADAARDAGQPHNLIVATFKQTSQAAAEFDQLTPQLPATSRLSLFGESLLLSLPAEDDAAREKWFDQLREATTNIFVAVSNRPVVLNLQCIAPTTKVAAKAAQDLQLYLNDNESMALVPPWAPEYQRPKFAEQRAARQLWGRLNAAVSSTATNAALENYGRKYAAAVQRGAHSEIARLAAEQRKLTEKLADEAREQLRASATNPADSTLIDLHAALAKIEYTNRTARATLLRQVAACLGEIKYNGGQPDPGEAAAGAALGVAAQHSLMVELSWVQLNDAIVGLPALADWLGAQKCKSFKYDLFGGYGEITDD